MSDKLVFDYYYGKEAEQFSFYRIPRMLIKDAHFSSLSNDAKMLYGLMLDRMSLSVRNGWQDDNDRTYIIYTIEDIMEDLNCSKGTAVKIIAELDVKKGIGLIEKVRPGLGKPDIIYVKNFVGITVLENTEDETDDSSDFDCVCYEDENVDKTPEIPSEFTEVQNLDFKKSKNQTSRSSKIVLQEVQKLDLKKSKNQTSGGSKIRLKEVQNLDPNYNNNNYTDFNNTEYNQTNQIYTEYEHITSNRIYPYKAKRQIAMDKMDEINATTEYMRDILEYDMLKVTERDGHKVYDMDIVDELIDVMVCAMTSDQPYLNIGGENVPIQQVKSRFEQYNYMVLEYVMDSLKNNTTKIKNIRKYMLAALFNAPKTINNYYRSEISHDFYGEN